MKKETQVLTPWQRTKKAMEHERDSDTNCNWNARNDEQRLGKRLVEQEIRRIAETIQTVALLRSVKLLRRVLETWGDLLSLIT